MNHEQDNCFQHRSFTGESVAQSEWFTENQYASALDDTKDAPSFPSTPSLAGPQNAGTPATAGSTGVATGPAGKVDNLPSQINTRTSTSGVTDEQVQMLYNQLDDKDDEINKQAQTIARLRQQIEEQDETIQTIQKDRDTKWAETTSIQVRPNAEPYLRRPVVTRHFICLVTVLLNT